MQQIVAPTGNASASANVAGNLVGLLLHSASSVAAAELSPLAGPLQGAPDMLKVMRTVTVLFWLLCVACELRRALGTGLSLCLLPRCATRLAKAGDRFLFVSISSGRLVLVSVVTFVRIGMACSLMAHGAGRLSRARSLTDLVVNVGALSIILDVPTFVWTRGCNGGLWNRFLDVEARVSFADCLLEYNWDAEDEIPDEPETSENAPPEPGADHEDCDGEGESSPSSLPVEQPGELPTQTADESAEQPLRPTEQPMEQPAQQQMEPIGQGAEQPMEQPVELADQATQQSAHELVEPRPEPRAEEPTEQPTEQPAEPPAQPTEQHVGQPTEAAEADNGTEAVADGRADGAVDAVGEGADAGPQGTADGGADEAIGLIGRWSSAWSSPWSSPWMRKLIKRQGAADTNATGEAQS